MKANRWVAATLLVATLAGCTTTRNSFYANPTAVGDGQICRTLAGENSDAEFRHALRTELRMRGVSESDCSAIVQKENVAIGVGAVLGAVIVAAAANSDGGGRHHRHHGSETYLDIDIAVPLQVPADGQWDWDQYGNASGALVWGCRGVQTRELAHPDKCDGKEMADHRWPAKTF